MDNLKISNLAAEFPELKENTITITLNDDDINQAQDQEQNIIVPSEIWNDIYQSALPDQPWWDKIVINVDNLSVDFNILETELIKNGYYSLNENENGELVPEIIENYKEGDEYDIRVNVPQQQLNLQEKIVNVTNETTTEIVTPDNEFNGLSKVTVNNEVVIPTINLQEKTVNVTNETISEDVTPDEGFNGLSRVTVNNDVIVPKLETLTDKRIQKTGTLLVSDLMSNPTNDEGITKQSTFLVDIPDPIYPTITFDTITKNGTYTLDQLTIDTNEYFSRDSVIKVENELLNINNVFYYYNSRVININDINESNFTKLTFKKIVNNSSYVNVSDNHIIIGNSYQNSGLAFIEHYNNWETGYVNFLNNEEYISDGFRISNNEQLVYLIYINNGIKKLLGYTRYAFTNSTTDIIFYPCNNIKWVDQSN